MHKECQFYFLFHHLPKLEGILSLTSCYFGLDMVQETKNNEYISTKPYLL